MLYYCRYLIRIWAVSICFVSVTLADGERKLSLGAYYSKDNNSDTSIHYFPVAIEYTKIPWILKLTVPQVKIIGAGGVLIDGSSTLSSTQGNKGEASGLGDVLVGATYQLDPLGPGAPFIDIVIQAKLPTADESKGLGTGEVDYSLQADLYKIIGSTTYFATIGYRYRGRTSLFDLRDSTFFSLGAMMDVAVLDIAAVKAVTDLLPDAKIGVIYDYRAAASHLSTETHEIIPYLSWPLNSSWNIMTYVVAGFTPSSPDYALGTQVSYRW